MLTGEAPDREEIARMALAAQSKNQYPSLLLALNSRLCVKIHSLQKTERVSFVSDSFWTLELYQKFTMIHLDSFPCEQFIVIGWKE